MTQLTDEQQEQINQIRERLTAHRTEVDKYRGLQRANGDALRYYKAPDDIDFLLSLLDSDSQAAAPTEELTAASVLDQSLNTLRQIRDLAASSRSYVPQDNAAEMMLRLEALGFGAQEPRRGNTLWAMVMDAADEIESLRTIYSMDICAPVYRPQKNAEGTYYIVDSNERLLPLSAYWTEGAAEEVCMSPIEIVSPFG